jgi:hypothetical protein
MEGVYRCAAHTYYPLMDLMGLEHSGMEYAIPPPVLSSTWSFGPPMGMKNRLLRFTGF